MLYVRERVDGGVQTYIANTQGNQKCYCIVDVVQPHSAFTNHRKQVPPCSIYKCTLTYDLVQSFSLVSEYAFSG